MTTKCYFDWSGFRSHGNRDNKTYLDNIVCQFLSDAIMQQSQNQACPYDRFCLGMCDWTGCVGAKVKPQSQPHLPATSKSEPHLPSCERFEFTDEETLEKLSKGLIPVNTDRSTKWALKVFELWSEQRNQRFPEDPVPGDFFSSADPNLLNTHLSRFAVETRKTDGIKYPPATIHQLLCGLLRHMKEVNHNCINFLNKKDPRFNTESSD